MFKVSIRKEWCKGCSFCIQICPKKVFTQDKRVPEVKDREKCIGCRLCEYLCPDLAITVEKGEEIPSANACNPLREGKGICPRE